MAGVLLFRRLGLWAFSFCNVESDFIFGHTLLEIGIGSMDIDRFFVIIGINFRFQYSMENLLAKAWKKEAVFRIQTNDGNLRKFMKKQLIKLC